MRLLIFFSSFIFLSSCVRSKIFHNLQAHEKNQSAISRNLQLSTFNKRPITISWEDAVKRTLKNNTNIKNSRSSIARIKKAKKEQWKTVIPKLFAAASLNSAIDELANLSKENIDLNIVYSLNIPNPFTYYAQAYTLSLQEIQASCNHELIKREIVLSLYQTHLNSEQLKKERSELENSKEELLILPVNKLASQFSILQQKDLRLAEREERLRVRLNKLLNTPGKSWNLIKQKKEIAYANELDSLNFHTGYGQLGLKIQTIEIELGILQLRQIKFQRFPSSSIGISTPQLYGVSSENNFSFDTKDFRLFTGLNKAIKFDDILDLENLRNAKIRSEINRQNLLSRMESEISQLEINKARYKSLLLNKHSLTQSKKQYLQESTASKISPPPELQLKALSSINKQLEAINSQIQQLDIIFFLWDNNFWEKI